MALLDSLIAYWKCDEASGNLLDAHGSFTGTDHNTVGSGTGKINNCRTFSAAANEYFDGSSTIDDGITNAFTIAGWGRLSTGARYGDMFRNDGGAAASGCFLRVSNTDKIEGFVYNGSVNVRAGTTSLSTATWYYLAVVYDGATLTPYLNGVADNTGLSVTGNMTLGSNEFAIGAYSSVGLGQGEFWDGDIDELGFWGRALSSSELLQLYNSGSGFPYPFNPTDLSAVSQHARPNRTFRPAPFRPGIAR